MKKEVFLLHIILWLEVIFAAEAPAYLLINIIHPQAQRFPDRWVVIPATCLGFQESSLFQIV